MANNPFNLIDKDGGFAGPNDIILTGSSGEKLLILKSDVIRTSIQIHDKTLEKFLQIMQPIDVVSNKRSPKIVDIRMFDSYLNNINNLGEEFMSGDAFTISTGIDAAVLGGVTFSIDLVAFINGPDRGSIFLNWTRGTGGGWLQGGDISAGKIAYISNNIQEFTNNLILGHGKILNVGIGPAARSIFTNDGRDYFGSLSGYGAGDPGIAGYNTVTYPISQIK